MIGRRQKVIFRATLALGVGVILIQLWAIGKLMGKRSTVDEATARYVRQWQVLAHAPLVPGVANLGRLRAERAFLESEVAGLQEAFSKSAGELPAQSEASPETLYFELVELVEQMRSSFRESAIGVRPGEAFGFQRFLDAHQVGLPEGSDSAAGLRFLERVSLQREVVAVLLRELLKLRPNSLLSVEREAASPLSDAVGKHESGLFRRDDAPPWYLPEGLGRTGFRITFTGRTVHLRRFLQAVADLPFPCAVSAVTVRPMFGDRTAVAVGSDRRSRMDARLSLLGAGRPASEHIMERPVPSANVVPVVEASDSVFSVLVDVYTVSSEDEEVAVR